MIAPNVRLSLAKYRFLHLCDHHDDVFVKKDSDYEAMRDRSAEIVCSRCRFREEVEASKERTLRGDLASLCRITGSSRQIDYANHLRVQFFDTLMEVYRPVLSVADPALGVIAYDYVKALTAWGNAEWWIRNHRVPFEQMLIRWYETRHHRYPDLTMPLIRELADEVTTAIQKSRKRKTTKTVVEERERLEAEYQDTLEAREAQRREQDAEWDALERSAHREVQYA